jgi:phosphoglycolate phosphatase-like HAD superfamily hydrolase
MKKAVVFDLNKTLRKKSGKPRHDILKKAKKAEDKESVIVISGESDKDRKEARGWLDSHGLDEAQLEMRPNGDTEHDDKVKERILTDKVSRQFKVKKAYDDKPANVKMFEEHGIKAKKV